MSILNRQFIENIRNTIPVLETYDEYFNYLLNANLLNTELLSRVNEWNCDEDKECFMLYKYEDKYILIHIFIGTCSMCFHLPFNTVIDNAIERAYVSTNIEDIKNYYNKYLSYVPL